MGSLSTMIVIGNAQYLGDRENQEDYFASQKVDKGVLCILADGMGGYKGGEVASVVVVKAFKSFFKEYFKTTPIEELLLNATHFSNKELLLQKEQQPEFREMGSTLVALYMTQNNIYWVSVGDSILYHFDTLKKLKRINASHAIGHRLTSALTGYAIPNIEVMSINIQTSDRFLIASDGIETLDDSVIEQMFIKIRPPQKLADELIIVVEKSEKKHQDNVTLMVLQQENKEKGWWMLWK